MTDSPRVRLRLLSPNDAEELLGLVDGSRNFLRGYLPWVDDFRTIEKSRSWIKSYALQYAMDNGGDWGIRRLSDDALLGCICLQWVQAGNRSGSLEYFLGKPYAGNGYATEALRLFEQICFGELGLHRLELHAAVTNTASCALAARAGFTMEGESRDYECIRGTFVDHKIFGILASDVSFTKVNGKSLPG